MLLVIYVAPVLPGYGAWDAGELRRADKTPPRDLGVMSERPGDDDFEQLLARAAILRGHLCLGLPLGIKMARKGLRLVGMEDPSHRDELVVFVENNRCAVDAVQVATGCSMGSRRLRVYEYGKSAATFYHRASGRAVRVFARPELTSEAVKLAVEDGILKEGEEVDPPSKLGRKTMMNAFMKLSEDEIFDHEEVTLKDATAFARGPPAPRSPCSACGEEILDGRGVRRDGRYICLACAGEAYYRPAPKG
jgi:formylmethanofuran dehydrogenase subunit E